MRTLTARIEQVIYNGPREYSHDYRWVVRDENRRVVEAGTSTSEHWAREDCGRSLTGDYTLTIDFDDIPAPIDGGNYHFAGPFVVSTGNPPDWPHDVQRFFDRRMIAI